MRRAALALVAGALALAAPAAAAGAPAIEATWVESVTATSANLRAKIDPDGLTSRYHFEYLTEAAYLAGGETFAGAARKPAGEGALVPGAGIAVFQHLEGLAPETAYYYRVVATNSASETSAGPPRVLATEEPTNVHPPIDGRGFELVSPIDKGGGAIAAPESLFGGGDFQAAARSTAPAMTYSSASSFAGGAGAPGASQYISTRGTGGWSTQNVTAPSESGAYGEEPDGVPFKLFSADLSRALMLEGRRCEEAQPCPRPYSLRDNGSGALTPLPAAAAGMRVLSASPDLHRILFEDEGGEVYEWSGAGLVPSEAPAEPEPVGGIVGVLGASASGDTVYYQDGAGLKQWRNGVVTLIAEGPEAAAPSDYPGATGTARVSADGQHLAFLSAAEIPPFDNIDANTGQPDTELYLYGPSPGEGSARLICASCNPSGERPQGSATIPGAQANGTTRAYKPRVLSASGHRLFFDSADKLVSADTDSRPDVYEWETGGEGDCTRSPGCLGLVSGGRGAGGSFLDASADGTDAYFLTEESLIGTDPGSVDVYDYRAGGGFPEAEAPFACSGDACQALPSPPEDPTPGTLVKNSGNPAQKYYSENSHRQRCPKGKRLAKRHGKARCVKKKRHAKQRHHRGRRG